MIGAGGHRRNLSGQSGASPSSAGRRIGNTGGGAVLLRHRNATCSNCGAKPMFVSVLGFLLRQCSLSVWLMMRVGACIRFGLRWRCLHCPVKYDLCDFCYRTGAHGFRQRRHGKDSVASSLVSKESQARLEAAVIRAVVGGSAPKVRCSRVQSNALRSSVAEFGAHGIRAMCKTQASQLTRWLSSVRSSETVEDLASPCAIPFFSFPRHRRCFYFFPALQFVARYARKMLLKNSNCRTFCMNPLWRLPFKSLPECSAHSAFPCLAYCTRVRNEKMFVLRRFTEHVVLQARS